MRWIVLVMVALGAAPSFAEPPVPVSPAADEVVCNVLAGADYVPGVAADGSAVAPADLPPDAARANVAGAAVELPRSRAASRGKVVVGEVTVKDGKTYLNGAPLVSDPAIAAACAGKR